MKQFPAKSLLSFALVVSASASPVYGGSAFLGLSAGDMTQTTAVLWARVENPPTLAATIVVAKDQGFQQIVATLPATIKPENNSTFKVGISGLQPNTQYFYRATAGRTKSTVGSFFTNPDPAFPAAFRVAFTGDSDQKYRPFPAIEMFGSAANPGTTALNAFIYLGDTIYETTAKGLKGFGKISEDKPDPDTSAIPTGTSTAADALHALNILNKRYDANIQGVSSTGVPHNRAAPGLNGARTMLSATGVYTLLDNHEIFGALQSGGASPKAIKENWDPVFATNPSGPYNNDTIAFLAETKAFYNNMPTAVNIDGAIDPAKSSSERHGLSFSNVLTPDSPVVTSSDPRSSGKPANYFSRRWGKNIYYIQLDDRSFRDARMAAPGRYALTPAQYPLQEARFDAKGKLVPEQAYQTGFQKGDPLPGVFMSANQAAGRTMLGADQLAWVLSELDKAKATKALWTVIAVSTPIDQRGTLTDSKSWVGGYVAERNILLKRIVDLSLHNVVFLTTDDHNARVTSLKYQPDPANESRWEPVPYAFQLLAGPAGAVGPDAPPYSAAKTLETDYPVVASQAVATNAELESFQQPGIGLVGYPGLTSVYRLFDNAALTQPSSVDFFSPDTFGYTTLDWGEAGNLTVNFWGIKAYGPNLYPRNFKTPQKILSFSISPS
jgi:alkaline phosphatase D